MDVNDQVRDKFEPKEVEEIIKQQENDDAKRDYQEYLQEQEEDMERHR